MLTPGTLWLFVIPFLLAAMLPGPAQAALVSQVVTRGSKRGLYYICGMVLGNFLWLLIAALGLSAAVARFEVLFVAVKWLGVAYLLYVARGLWIAPAGIAEAKGTDAHQHQGAFAGGMATTLANPKAVVFFGAILPQAIDLTALTLPGLVEICAIGLTIDFAVQLSYVLLAAWFRKTLSTPRQIRLVNRSASGVIAGAAGFIAVKG